MSKRKKREAHLKKRLSSNTATAGIFVPAGLFIGLGLGGFVNNYGAGALLGLGAGFLSLALIRLLHSK